MQLVFISDEAQVIKFLSGLQAEARMPRGRAEVSGLSKETLVTVMCAGISTPYRGVISAIESGYETLASDGGWLGIRLIVRKINLATSYSDDQNVAKR